MNAAAGISEIITQPDRDALAQEAARRFVALAGEAARARGRFTVALAGGSTPEGLYRLLAQPPYREQLPWPQALIFFGDERCVPPEHPWSNYRMAREAFLDGVPLPPGNIHRIPGELPAEEAAAAYAQDLRRAFNLRGAARPVFDLILLGLGDDGHTASLFPGMPALEERRRLVAATAVPNDVQPAVSRVTLTFPTLNAARTILFLVAGANKARSVRAVLAHAPAAHPEQGRAAAQSQAPLPAARIRPAQGRLVWLLDQAAAASL